MSSMALFAGGQQEGGTPEETIDGNNVEVLHWWTAGSEAAALNVFKRRS